MGSEMPTTEGIFTRASSGLVRQVRTDDIVYWGWFQIGLGYIFFTIFAWALYPGASMELAALIALVGAIAIGLAYALLSSIYPRSGGDYVSVSRVLHPSIGFGATWSFAFWELYYYGVNGAFLAIFGLAPLFGTLGLQTGNEFLVDAGSWFTTAWGMFITGGVAVLSFAYILHRGMGTYFRIQRWIAYATAVSLISMIVVLILASLGILDFESNFDNLANQPGAYQAVIDAAAEGGGAISAPFSVIESLKFLIWPAFSLWFGVAAVSFSGEIKNAQRGQLIGIPTTMITMGIALIALMFFSRGAFGSDFLIAASTVASDEWPLAVDPYMNVFAGIAGGNVFVTVLVNVWVVLMLVFIMATDIIYATRAMVAWSIDGVVPDKVADVSPRYHSPTVAIAISVVLGLIWLAIFSFTSLVSVLSGFLGFAPGFIVVSLAAILIPFRKSAVFEGSPVAWRIGGMPVVSIVGAIGLVFSLYLGARLLMDDNFGANSEFSIWVTSVVLAIGFIGFFVARTYRRSRGEDIDRRYHEIPIE